MVDCYEFQIPCNTICDRYCFFVWDNNDRIGERKYKNLAKDKWELPDVIPIMPIVGVNHSLPILHLSKRMVHIYGTEKTIHQFAIGYIISPSLHINSIFREKVQKCLGCYFSIKTMKKIRDFLLNKNTSVMELIMIYKTW